MRKFDESNIKRYNNMFIGTQKNMVFCINKSSKIYSLKDKSCSIIDCTDTWKNKRKYFVEETNQCVDSCPEEYPYLFNFNCLFKCPYGMFPIYYNCKNIDEIGLYRREDEVDLNCTIQKYFEQKCKISLIEPQDKQRFIEKTSNQIIKGYLNELIVNITQNKTIYTIRNENEVYQLYSLTNKNKEEDLIHIDMDYCGIALKEKNRIDENDDIIIFKVEYRSDEFRIPIVEYNLYGNSGSKKLSLNPCSNIKLIYYIPLNISDFERDKYDPQSDYYNDECNAFTTEYKTDILLRDRQIEFNKNNLSLCEEMCTFIEYMEDKKIIKCECDIKKKFNSFMNVNVNKYNLIHRFNINNKTIHNFWVFKCYYLIFSLDIIASNLFSQIILCIIIFHFLGVFIFYIIGQNILYEKIKIMLIKAYKLRQKSNDIGTNIFNYIKTQVPPRRKMNDFFSKNLDSNSNSKMSLNDKKNNNKSITNQLTTNENKTFINTKNKNIEDKTDNELNSLSYYDAIIEDKRTFCQIYCSLLRTNQILFFSFKSQNDYNSRIIKICFIFYIFALLIFFNTAFMTDKIVNNIYIFKGKWNLSYSYISIICSSLIASLVKNILIETMFTESDVLSIKYTFNKNIIKKTIGIVVLKSILFFVISILSLACIWVYVTCYFTVFKNSQDYVIINIIIGFAILLIEPLVFHIIPAFVRFISLANRKKKNKLCLYIFSKILLVLI